MKTNIKLSASYYVVFLLMGINLFSGNSLASSENFVQEEVHYEFESSWVGIKNDENEASGCYRVTTVMYRVYEDGRRLAVGTSKYVIGDPDVDCSEYEEEGEQGSCENQVFRGMLLFSSYKVEPFNECIYDILIED